MKRLLFIITALITLAAAPRAQATWDRFFCDISDSKNSGIMEAIEDYQAPLEEDRRCTQDVRFMEPDVYWLPDGIEITAMPPLGQVYGFGIRRCISIGPYAEPGCPTDLSADDIILDFSHYIQDSGDCPVRIANGARVSFVNLKLIVENPAKAICTEDGNPIAFDDLHNDYVYLHNLTIVPAIHSNRPKGPLIARAKQSLWHRPSGPGPVERERRAAGVR